MLAVVFRAASGRWPGYCRPLRALRADQLPAPAGSFELRP